MLIMRYTTGAATFADALSPTPAQVRALRWILGIPRRTCRDILAAGMIDMLWLARLIAMEQVRADTQRPDRRSSASHRVVGRKSGGRAFAAASALGGVR